MIFALMLSFAFIIAFPSETHGTHVVVFLESLHSARATLLTHAQAQADCVWTRMMMINVLSRAGGSFRRLKSTTTQAANGTASGSAFGDSASGVSSTLSPIVLARQRQAAAAVATQEITTSPGASSAPTSLNHASDGSL